MNYFHTVVFILSVLISKGYSLSCVQCESLQSICTGPSEECAPGEDACVSVALKTVVARGEQPTQYFRSCGKSNFCGKNPSISKLGSALTGAITCCSSDNCDPPIPQLPPRSAEKNGVTCNVCPSEGSNSCIAMNCTGNERTCIKVVSTTTGPLQGSQTIEGCASQDACDSAEALTGAVPPGTKIEVTCNNGNPVFYYNLIILVISASLHFNLMY
ncbi:phospholipase A2 inhibitor and Ly6/PLAUR domain-containing protein [Bombina bombina]|uniref:phospholipase A2 inhibitor and Ly6/PLAUR domain-containing protein n=1 Tax=Bombina bombina TaxID=8345 RepID=UPI00235AB5C3|nr:phospholipase A2 inhibitor and Ly6/PLAUR domain-containing protein [Bombina bombina]